jgi:hypothetical protein
MFLSQAICVLGSLQLLTLCDDHHREQISGSRSRKSLFCCVFGLMEERGELPKQLSRRKKPGVRIAGHSETSILAILDASNIPRVSQNCVFQAEPTPMV